MAVASFSKGRVMKNRVVPYRSYECVRFACELGTTVVGVLGKLISAFEQNHHPDHLMSYADRDWGTGKGYTASWIHMGTQYSARTFLGGYGNPQTGRMRGSSR